MSELALFRAAFKRWRRLPRQQALNEMAALFDLAAQIEEVDRLAKEKGF